LPSLVLLLNRENCRRAFECVRGVARRRIRVRYGNKHRERCAIICRRRLGSRVAVRNGTGNIDSVTGPLISYRIRVAHSYRERGTPPCRHRCRLGLSHPRVGAKHRTNCRTTCRRRTTSAAGHQCDSCKRHKRIARYASSHNVYPAKVVWAQELRKVCSWPTAPNRQVRYILSPLNATGAFRTSVRLTVASGGTADTGEFAHKRPIPGPVDPKQKSRAMIERKKSGHDAAGALVIA